MHAMHGAEQIDGNLVGGKESPEAAVALVPITAVRSGSSPRHGLNTRQVAALVELDGAWEPILVRRGSLEVVDGRHRLAAAERLGHSVVRVTFFDGSDSEALVEAIRVNVSHGFPLTQRERTAAARELLTLHPEWSDRQLASTCGLSPRTIAHLRPGAVAAPADGGPVLREKRVGRDGRRYPTDAVKQRNEIRRLLEEDRGASLRAVAAKAGASPETVRSVRLSLAAERHVPLELPHVTAAPEARAAWSNDTACLSTPEGQSFVEWFEQRDLDESDLSAMAAAVPLSRAYGVIDDARRRMALWGAFVEILQDRVYSRTSATVPHSHARTHVAAGR